jgi:putative peptide zinc metalloprotease protein
VSRAAAVLAALLLALGLAVGAPGAAHADNSAVAVNTKDGSSVFRFAFAIRHVMGDVVDETNSAVSFASCTDCRTTAIAIEIVLVAGSPSTFTPTNQAIAINYQCTLCETFAAAYQFVVQNSGPVHFTSDALVELKDIRKAIRELEDEDLTPFELQQRLNPLIDRLRQVLATGLVSGPPPSDNSENDNQDQSNAGESVPQHEGDHTTTATGPDATATQTGSTDTTTTAPQSTTTAPTTTSTEPATTESTPTTTTTQTTTTP